METQIDTLNRELLRCTARGVTSHYGRLPRDVKKRIDQEIDVIIENGCQAPFILVKDLMDRLDLGPEAVMFGAGIGYQSLVAFLMGITDINPFNFNKYCETENWMVSNNAFFNLHIPYSRYEEAVSIIEKSIHVNKVHEEEVAGDKTVTATTRIYSPNKKTDLLVGVFIMTDKRLDVLSDMLRIDKNKDFSIINREKSLKKALHFIIEQSKKAVKEAGDNSNSLMGIPLLNNEGVKPRISESRPKDIYELAECIREAVELEKDSYTTVLGMTKIACELAYYKSKIPSEFYHSYVENVATENTVDILNRGIDAISEKLNELIYTNTSGKIEGGQSEILAMGLEEYTRMAEEALAVIAEVIAEKEQDPPSEECSFEELVDDDNSSAKDRYVELKKKIQESVVGNEELVDALALALISSEMVGNGADNNENAECYPKQHMLIVGGTGTGKTFTVKKAAMAAGREFVDVNLAEISAVGYVGKDLESVLETKASSSTPEKWKKAVIFLDELDKVILSGGTREKERTFDLVPELLKLIESETMSLKVGKDKRVEVPTRNILFIFAGAFEEINNTILERLGGNKRIGFNFDENTNNKHEADDDSILKEITVSDFEKYGVSRQLIGRMNRIVVTSPMNEEGYKRILMESSDSAFLKQRKLLKDAYKIDLSISEDAIDAIASECTKMKVGARGLSSIINTAVSKGLAEALSQNNVVGINIVPDDEDCVRCDMKYRTRRTIIA